MLLRNEGDSYESMGENTTRTALTKKDSKAAENAAYHAAAPSTVATYKSQYSL
jgi:hypothetical protein